MRTLRRSLAVVITVTLALAMSGASVMAKHTVLVELFYNSVWNDHTSDVYTRDQIVINHAAGNEQSGVVPSDAQLTFDNRTGKMNPDNRKSPLFGLIGYNTPIRITVDDDIRFSGQIVSYKPRRAIKGDAWVHIQAQGHIRALGQGEQLVRSPMTRALAAEATNVPLAWWPLETDLLSANAPSGRIADSPVGPASVDPLTYISDGVTGASALTDLSNGTRIDLSIPNHTLTPATGYYVEFISRWQPDGFTGSLSVDAVRLKFDAPGDSTTTDRVDVETNTSKEVFVFAQAAPSGSASDTTGVTVYDGVSRHFLLNVKQVDDDVEADLFVDDVFLAAATLTSTTLTKLQLVSLNFVGESGTKIPAIGQVAVYNVATAGHPSAAAGHSGEFASTRFERLCDQLGITSTIVGPLFDTQIMGVQYPDTDLNLFAETARTDAGVIHDTRSQLGLTFRTGRSLYNQ